MVKQKVSCLCGNIKKNLLRRNQAGNSDNSAPGTPALNRNNIPTTSSFDKSSSKQSEPSSREEILCIFDKSLTVQHDTDEENFEIPPEPPPRIFYPKSKSPNVHGPLEELAAKGFLSQEVVKVKQDDRTPSEHSRSTASEIFVPTAPSISSHSSNSSTESFHCEGCYCSRKSSQLQLTESSCHLNRQPNFGVEEFLKMASPERPTHRQSGSMCSSDSLDLSSTEHSYSSANRNTPSVGVIIPPCMLPSTVSTSAPNSKVGDSRRTSAVSCRSAPSPFQPPPFLPPKNFIATSAPVTKKCDCTNCRVSAANHNRASTSSNFSQPSEAPFTESNRHSNMLPCTPKRTSRVCERKQPKESPEYENRVEPVMESSWPEIGEVLPTVSAFLQSKNCHRRHNSCSKTFDKLPLTLLPQQVPVSVDIEPVPPQITDLDTPIGKIILRIIHF